ncbi:hypothetical protein BH10PSE13_BH10PSE13_11040 [soil metagenome]
MRTAISGTGIASTCCAHLLGLHGIEVLLTPAVRPPVPAILLSDPALALLRDVFGRPDLFADRPCIARRIVSWGGGEPIALPHGAVVVSEGDLVTALSPMAADTASGVPADFTIHTAAPFPAGDMMRFGTRSAMAARVHLNFAEDEATCWIEAVDGGWLFLIPDGGAQSAWLLCVGGPIEALLDESRHISPRVTLSGSTSSAFETCPRMLTRLQGTDWLACGTAALAFDPICGDGTAHAIREAIIASAVIAAIRDGGDAEALRTHHESMLIAAMRRHLLLCAQFYQSGGTGRWWQDQLGALSQGHDWATSRLATMPEPRYHLRDFSLVPREAAA